MTHDVHAFLVNEGYEDALTFLNECDENLDHMEREDAKEVFCDAYHNILDDVRRVDPDHKDDWEADFEIYYDGWSMVVNDEPRMWYAVHGYNNDDQSDWDSDDGDGSYFYDEAVEMAKAMDTRHAAIAFVLDERTDDTDHVEIIK